MATASFVAIMRPWLRRSLALGAILATAQACGGAPNPPVVAKPAPAARAATSPIPVPPAVPATRGPSEVLRTHSANADGAELAIYADVAGLARTPLGQSILPLLSATKEALAPDQLQCVKDVLASAQEVLIAGAAPLILVRFDESAAAPGTCLAAFGAAATHLEGAPDAYRLADMVVSHLPGLLVIGNASDVVKAVQPTPPWSVPASLALADDEYLAWTANTPQDPDIQSARGRLVASASRFRLDVDAQVDEHAAAQIEAFVQDAKMASSIQGIGPEAMPMIKALLAAVTLKRDGKHVTAALDLEEPVGDQLRDLSVAIYGVRKYIANARARTSEARHAVGQDRQGHRRRLGERGLRSKGNREGPRREEAGVVRPGTESRPQPREVPVDCRRLEALGAHRLRHRVPAVLSVRGTRRERRRVGRGHRAGRPQWRRQDIALPAPGGGGSEEPAHAAGVSVARSD